MVPRLPKSSLPSQRLPQKCLERSLQKDTYSFTIYEHHNKKNEFHVWGSAQMGQICCIESVTQLCDRDLCDLDAFHAHNRGIIRQNSLLPTDHHGDEAPSAELTPSECCSPKECDHPPTAYQQRSNAAGPAGYPLYPGSSSSHCRWYPMIPLPM